ncbi:basic proline-rich protein-like [Peromyscus leucopus]|uniref:basic proline-rich protein-like n=1 Tax=Peromyscus leucopus TaxID=10041 RepID=UPI0010A18E5F|nr:basic proline-rich protein-like [Peromyscus leucopus]
MLGRDAPEVPARGSHGASASETARGAAAPARKASWRAGTEATHSPGGGCHRRGPGFVNEPPRPPPAPGSAAAAPACPCRAGPGRPGAFPPPTRRELGPGTPRTPSRLGARGEGRPGPGCVTLAGRTEGGLQEELARARAACWPGSGPGELLLPEGDKGPDTLGNGAVLLESPFFFPPPEGSYAPCKTPALLCPDPREKQNSAPGVSCPNKLGRPREAQSGAQGCAAATGKLSLGWEVSPGPPSWAAGGTSRRRHRPLADGLSHGCADSGGLSTSRGSGRNLKEGAAPPPRLTPAKHPDPCGNGSPTSPPSPDPTPQPAPPAKPHPCQPHPSPAASPSPHLTPAASPPPASPLQPHPSPAASLPPSLTLQPHPLQPHPSPAAHPSLTPPLPPAASLPAASPLQPHPSRSPATLSPPPDLTSPQPHTPTGNPSPQPHPSPPPAVICLGLLCRPSPTVTPDVEPRGPETGIGRRQGGHGPGLPTFTTPRRRASVSRAAEGGVRSGSPRALPGADAQPRSPGEPCGVMEPEDQSSNPQRPRGKWRREDSGLRASLGSLVSCRLGGPGETLDVRL